MRIQSVILGFCCVGVIVAATEHAFAQGRIERRTTTTQRVDGEPVVGYTDSTLQLFPVDLGKYWIGLMCEEASATLRHHLKIKEGGLTVQGTHEGSAAAKAGLKEHDVVLSANGNTIKSIKDLIDAVQKAETGDLKLELIRDGQRIEVVVNPQERPEGDQGAIVLQDRPLKWPPSQTGVRAMGRQLLLLEPGRIVPHAWHHRAAAAHPRLPNGTSVSITRKTGEPTTIHVKRGDKEWKLKENELHELPADLRGPIGAMLGNHPVEYRIDELRNLHRPTATKPQYSYTTVVPQQPATKNELNELRKAIQTLTEKIDRLEKKDE